MNQIPLGVMDEDSGELILCPFCDSPNHCEHLLLLVDDTFLTWIGGYAKDQMSEFTTVIKEHFVARLKDSGGQNISYSCEFLEELWSLVADHGSEGESICLTRLPLSVEKAGVINDPVHQDGGGAEDVCIDEGDGARFERGAQVVVELGEEWHGAVLSH